MRRTVFATLAFVFLVTASVEAQFVNKWLSAGSLHSWYSEVGSECEECGFVKTQQDGLRWPGIYQFRDVQAAKGIWLGAKNVKDDIGGSWDLRVVHAGPRVNGSGEFFPVKFELVTKRTLPPVFVDGALSEPASSMIGDRVDPTIAADAMLVNEVNTLLGLTMERRIMQFSDVEHDNYHVTEYVLTNTGNTDGDDEIEIEGQTLEDVYLYLQWRYSVAKETRFVIGNGTGWGLNAMLDTRGDGVKPDPAGEEYRAQFVWHGKFPPFALYDNIGGPILPQALPAINVSDTDTLGRLGASHFVGVVTIHADTSPSDVTDDLSQPSTTDWIGSDESFTSNNDAFNPAKMGIEYDLMTFGHRSPRHADAVEPSGMAGFLNPTGDPANGTPGGYSNANGYGPYTLGPGESVRIVIAEAVAGLSREANRAIGHAYRDSGTNDDAPIAYNGESMTKNEWVFTSRDSLFQTFGRATANFKSGYTLTSSPAPPSFLDVNGGGDRISVRWEPYAEEALPDGWEVYRAQGKTDSNYTLVFEAGSGETLFDDTTPIRGIDYYYNVVAVKDGRRSNRYFSQTYTPARLKRQAGEQLEDVRIVPNPYNISSNPNIRFPDQIDKLAFFNIPGQCTIEIYTELGELVERIEHTDGSGDEFWDHTTSSRQVVVSGIYIAVISDTETGERIIKKFAIIR
jgi:hypothetical protein